MFKKISVCFFRFSLVLCLSFSLSLFHPQAARAQAVGQNEEVQPTLTGPRKQLATIIFAGLGGAILGLSTLSFYGRPQDHLENIAMGFGIGVIGGTIWGTYQAATAPEDFYALELDEPYTRQAMYRLSEPTLKIGWDF